jgi:hypothetical protein
LGTRGQHANRQTTETAESPFTLFFASRTKRDRRKQEGLAYIRLMLKLKWKRERSQMQQCQKGKLQEIKKPLTYHGVQKRGETSTNLGVLLYRRSSALSARNFCASQRAYGAL